MQEHGLQHMDYDGDLHKRKSMDSGRYHGPERLLIDSRITGFYEFYDIFIDGITKKQYGFFEIKR